MSHLRQSPDRRRDLLRVTPLVLPRSWRGPQAPWEIDQRGFRLRILGPDLLALTLGAPGPKTPGGALSRKPGPGEETLLVVPAPKGPPPEALEAARSVPQEEGWTPACLLVLSDREQLPSPPRARRELGRALRGAGFAAAWVLDASPQVDFRGLPYFTVERSLRQLGRVGRRLERWARWRRLWPW